MSNTIEITESQKSLLVDYVGYYDITEWVEAGEKITEDRYRISVNCEQLEEMISSVQYMTLKAEDKDMKKELKQLANYLNKYLMNEY